MESAGFLFIGIAAAVVIPLCLIFGVIIWFCWRGIKQTKQQSIELNTAPLVDIKKLKNGLQKIEGKIRAQDDLLRSPLARKKCVYFRFRVEELRQTGHGRHRSSSWVTVIDDKQWIDFNIDDGTGEVEVHIEEAEVALHSKAFTSSGTFDGASQELEDLMNRRYSQSTKGWLFNKSMRYTETWLRDGDTVMIVGDVKKKKGSPEFYKGDHHLLVTDMDEKQVGSMYTGRATGYWIGLVFCCIFLFAACGAGGIFAIVGGAIGFGGPKIVENIHHDRNPFPKDNPFQIDGNPFEKDRKKNEPPIVQNEPKPRPINPAWADAKMNITWLSDLKEENVRVGWGRFGKNGMMGYQPNGAPNEDAPVLMDGKPFTKSISMHPPDFGESVVQYRLQRQHKLLKAMVCLADMPATTKGAESAQTFKVYGDGELLWVSQPPIKDRLNRQNLRISVENVDTLELRVHCAGSKVYAWTVWINPQLLK